MLSFPRRSAGANSPSEATVRGTCKAQAGQCSTDKRTAKKKSERDSLISGEQDSVECSAFVPLTLGDPHLGPSPGQAGG